MAMFQHRRCLPEQRQRNRPSCALFASSHMGTVTCGILRVAFKSREWFTIAARLVDAKDAEWLYCHTHAQSSLRTMQTERQTHTRTNASHKTQNQIRTLTPYSSLAVVLRWLEQNRTKQNKTNKNKMISHWRPSTARKWQCASTPPAAALPRHAAAATLRRRTWGCDATARRHHRGHPVTHQTSTRVRRCPSLRCHARHRPSRDAVGS